MQILQHGEVQYTALKEQYNVTEGGNIPAVKGNKCHVPGKETNKLHRDSRDVSHHP